MLNAGVFNLWIYNAIPGYVFPRFDRLKIIRLSGKFRIAAISPPLSEKHNMESILSI